MPAEVEKALKNCNSLKQIRSAGDSFGTEVAESVKAPVDLLSDIMRRLELNGKNNIIRRPEEMMHLPHERNFGKPTTLPSPATPPSPPHSDFRSDFFMYVTSHVQYNYVQNPCYMY